MTRLAALIRFFIPVYLLVVVGTVTSNARAAETGSEPDASTNVGEPASAASNVAYMDLTLTTTDEYGGEITVDEAFSLYFRSDATDAWDAYDASKMLPRGDTWAVIAFEGVKNGKEVLKAQESRPYEDSVQVVDVKLVQQNMPAATYTITVDRWYSVPSNWSLRLRSQALDTTFVIDEATDTVSFKLDSSGSTQKASSSQHIGAKATTDTSHVSMAGEVGPKSTSLPVELSTFTATSNQKSAVLKWETSSELNNSGFAVQHRRASAGAGDRDWSRLGFVEGEGTTDRPQQYRFNTDPLDPGKHLFRLKQIDRDGTTELSATVKVVRRPEGALELSTAPNPFTTRLTIAVTARSEQTARIQLVDMLGRVVQQSGPVQLRANTRTRKQIDGRRLASGSYILRVKGETFTSTRRVMHVR